MEQIAHIFLEGESPTLKKMNKKLWDLKWRKSHTVSPLRKLKQKSNAISYIVQSWMSEVSRFPPTSWPRRILLEQG